MAVGGALPKRASWVPYVPGGGHGTGEDPGQSGQPTESALSAPKAILHVPDHVLPRFICAGGPTYSLNGTEEGVENFGFRERCVPVLLIRHKVTHFETWRQAFLEDGSIREANGARGSRFFRSDVDPSEVWILLEWDDLYRARLFVKSDDLIEAIVRGGVTDHPDFWFLEDSGRP